MDRAGYDQTVELRRIEWSETVERHFELIPQTDPTISGNDWHKKELAEGKVALYGVFVNGEHVGSGLTAVYEGDNGSEYAGLALGGEDFNVMKECLRGLEILAMRAGCKVLRLTTCRKGLVKIAETEGFTLDEYVIRKAIHVEQ